MRARKRPAVDWRGQAHLDVGARVVPVEPEASVLQRVQEALWAFGGVLVMRNTVGATRAGRRYITYGLGVGSADIVAIVAPYGRWLCIETKRPKGAKATDEQEAWLRKVRAYGAVAGVCRSPEEAIALVYEARRPPPGLVEAS